MKKAEVIDLSQANDPVGEVRGILCWGPLQYYPLVERAAGPKIDYFGDVVIETRQTSGERTEDFYMLARRFGWAVALVKTRDGKFLLNVQPKPGQAAAGVEFPAGGIGKDPARTPNDIVRLTVDQVLKETGYGNPTSTCYLGFCIIESGKMFDPAAVLEDETEYEPGIGRGLKAHLVFLDGVEAVAEQQLTTSERIQPFLVSRGGLVELVRQNVLVETSAVNCFTLAFLKGLI